MALESSSARGLLRYRAEGFVVEQVSGLLRGRMLRREVKDPCYHDLEWHGRSEGKSALVCDKARNDLIPLTSQQKFWTRSIGGDETLAEHPRRSAIIHAARTRLIGTPHHGAVPRTESQCRAQADPSADSRLRAKRLQGLGLGD